MDLETALGTTVVVAGDKTACKGWNRQINSHSYSLSSSDELDPPKNSPARARFQSLSTAITFHKKSEMNRSAILKSIISMEEGWEEEAGVWLR